MRLKLDENIAVSAKPRLIALGHDVDTVLDEGLGGRSDDFLVAWFASPDAKEWEGCFVVATPNKVRVVRQGPPA